MSTLECHELVAGHGRVVAVRDFDLEADAGSVTAILGPNGAGKTTLLETIAGLRPRLGGEVVLEGSALKNGRARAANKAGVVLVPDDRSLFTSLSVRENVKLAQRDDGMSFEEVSELFPALSKRWKISAGAISGGEQQMLAMARALVQKPKVLLLDEMSTGLAPMVVETLLPLVRHVSDNTGTVVLLVEQHVQLALEIADHAVVLVHGEVTLSGGARDLSANTAAIEAAYMGAGT
jgi:branched-chain amino acid transport system ATP-binding protein